MTTNTTTKGVQESASTDLSRELIRLHDAIAKVSDKKLAEDAGKMLRETERLLKSEMPEEQKFGAAWLESTADLLRIKAPQIMGEMPGGTHE